MALKLVCEHLSCRCESHPIPATERDESEIYLCGFHIRFEYDGQSVTGAAMAHEPSVQLAAEASTGFWVFGNFLDKRIDFIQASDRSGNVTIGHLDNMINNTDKVSFEERMPDKTHQVF